MTASSIPEYVNIRGEILEELGRSACAACRAEMCMRTRSEAAGCRRKLMLDQVPGIGNLLHDADYGLVDACPYSLIEEEESK